MTTRMIHFGPDDCHRLMVFRSAGYSIEACGSLSQLHTALRAGGSPEAVFISEGEGIAPQEALSLTKVLTPAPVVLFRSTNRAYEDTGFDLVIHALTPPEVWLKELDALIGKNLAGRSASRLLAPELAQQRRNIALALDKSRIDRSRRRLENRRAGPPALNPGAFPNSPMK